MTARHALRALLLACLVLGLAGTGLAAEKPSPQELWKLYPLDPAPGPRRTVTSEAERGPAPAPPATASTTARQPPARRPEPAAGASRSDRRDGAPLSLGLLLGGLLASLLMLTVAVFPERAIPRLGGAIVAHRLEMAIAGTLTLLAVTVMYVAIA